MLVSIKNKTFFVIYKLKLQVIIKYQLTNPNIGEHL